MARSFRQKIGDALGSTISGIVVTALVAATGYGIYLGFASHHNYDRDYIFFPPYAWYVIIDHHLLSAPTDKELAQQTVKYNRYAALTISRSGFDRPEDAEKIERSIKYLKKKISILPNKNQKNIQRSQKQLIIYLISIVSEFRKNIEIAAKQEDKKNFVFRVSDQTKSIERQLRTFPGMSEWVDESRVQMRIWKSRIEKAVRQHGINRRRMELAMRRMRIFEKKMERNMKSAFMRIFGEPYD